jgi:hypothetical protein
MSLANTTWIMPASTGVVSITVSFGPSQAASPVSGGNGTYVVKYPTDSVSTDILWIEMPDGRFMFQFKGPTDPGNKELPTYTGQHSSGSASGWYSNFDAAWAATPFTMKVKGPHH